MMRKIMGIGLCGVLALAVSGGAVLAQDKTPGTGTKPEPKTDSKTGITTVTVTGQKSLNRIDRQVYDNTKDPDSKTGTALDALAKVPGVSVDPSGEVTLRGKSPQILINGRPASQLDGDSRAAALRSMASGSITSIEVTNNPGAQYGTGSSAGVINLITTTVLPAGGFASLQGQSNGGYSLSTSGHAPFGRLNLSGSLGLYDFKNDSLNGSARKSLDADGRTLRSTEGNGHSTGDFQSTFVNLTADYRLSKSDVLSAGLMYSRSSGSSENDSRSVIYNTAGVATDISASTGAGDNGYERQTASLSWSHNGKPGETLKVDWRLTQGSNAYGYDGRSSYSLASVASNLAGYASQSGSHNRSGNSTFSVDYNRPIGDDELTAGMQITSDTSLSRSGFTAPGTAALGTLTHSEFDSDQTVSSYYATYQKPLGDHWTVLGGLRVETFALDGAAPLVSLTSRVRYTNYNPSLFATYVVSDAARVRFSYAHRLQRPFATDYNPQTIQTSETSVTAGQTRLTPQQTNTYEIGYEYGRKGASYSLRGYYTTESHIVTSVSTFIPDPLNLGNLVLRTSRSNAGTRDTAGMEATFSGKLTPKLSLNANGNLTRVALDTPNFSRTQTVTGLTGRVSFNYQATEKDSLYLSFNTSPKTLDTQGSRTGYSSLGLQYMRTLPKSATLTIAFSDLTRSNKTRSYTTTPVVEGFSVYSRPAPTFSISLSRSFGGKPPAGATRTTRTVIMTGGPAMR